MFATQERHSELTPAQYEVVNVLSCLRGENDVAALKSLLVRFLNERLQAELDGVPDGTFEALGKQHQRTPYKAMPC